MTLGATHYTSRSQQARVLTEGWLGANGYCLSCATALSRTPNGTRALDFTCKNCFAGYELKSKKGVFSNTVVDGAYDAMMHAIRQGQQPNLFLLGYTSPFEVLTLKALPRRFLVEPIVIRRNPLSANARRAGWVGCNLNLGLIPRSALIDCVINGQCVPKSAVMARWRESAAVEDIAPSARGWLMMIWGIVERLPASVFVLSDLYAYEDRLSCLFPHNRNIRAKIRQQLQILRDLGFIAFNGAGSYELIKSK